MDITTSSMAMAEPERLNLQAPALPPHSAPLLSPRERERCLKSQEPVRYAYARRNDKHRCHETQRRGANPER
jgi:hypothetical protein